MEKNPVKVVAAALYLTAHTDLQGQRLTYSRLPDRRPGTPQSRFGCCPANAKS